VILLNGMRRAVLDPPNCELAPLVAAEMKICNGSRRRVNPHISQPRKVA
jgi:hypothetical protein